MQKAAKHLKEILPGWAPLVQASPWAHAALKRVVSIRTEAFATILEDNGTAVKVAPVPAVVPAAS